MPKTSLKRIDLADMLFSWQRSMRAANKSAATVDTYTAGVTGFLRWCDRTGAETELTKPNVQEFIADLVASGAQPATALTRQKALKQFAAWLVDEGELDADPLLGLSSPKQDRKVIEPLTDDQLKALIEACRGKEIKDRRDEAVVRLMAETGMRAGEVIALQVADVDLDRGLVVVRKGKGGKGRIVGISPQAIASLDRYLRARRARGYEGGNLWVGARGYSFGYQGLDQSLRQRARGAGIAGFHLHLMRHTAATRWLRAGGSEQGLMIVAGWSTRNMLDRYTSASASERAAAEARGLGLGDL
jgi:site-specific recombinase XerD